MRRRAERAGARSTQARGARTHAGRASTRGVRARGARRHARRAGARCSRPSGPAFLFSFGRAQEFVGRGRGSGTPGVGPQGHRASPAPPRTHAKHLSHSRGGLKVSAAPGCALSYYFLKGARVSRVRKNHRRATREHQPNSEEAKHTHTHREKFHNPKKRAARIGIRAARTILGRCPMNAITYPGQHLGSELKPHAGNANTILKTSPKEMASRIGWRKRVLQEKSFFRGKLLQEKSFIRRRTSSEEKLLQ